MFNLQGSELIIILLLALVVLGPEKLPEAMRKAGQFYAELKKMSSGFQDEFKSAIDEPVREMRETANLIRDSADFRKLQDGDRVEKPHSAEMADATSPDEQDAPTDADDLETAAEEPTASDEPTEPTEPTESTESTESTDGGFVEHGASVDTNGDGVGGDRDESSDDGESRSHEIVTPPAPSPPPPFSSSHDLATTTASRSPHPFSSSQQSSASPRARPSASEPEQPSGVVNDPDGDPTPDGPGHAAGDEEPTG